jgi:hypothetical protein
MMTADEGSLDRCRGAGHEDRAGVTSTEGGAAGRQGSSKTTLRGATRGRARTVKINSVVGSGDVVVAEPVQLA